MFIKFAMFLMFSITKILNNSQLIIQKYNNSPLIMPYIIWNFDDKQYIIWNFIKNYTKIEDLYKPLNLKQEKPTCKNYIKKIIFPNQLIKYNNKFQKYGNTRIEKRFNSK
jgi:hypothetical protein